MPWNKWENVPQLVGDNERQEVWHYRRVYIERKTISFFYRGVKWKLMYKQKTQVEKFPPSCHVSYLHVVVHFMHLFKHHCVVRYYVLLVENVPCPENNVPSCHSIIKDLRNKTRKKEQKRNHWSFVILFFKERF